MQYSKESTLKIMDEITNRRIDIKKTIERAAEFDEFILFFYVI